MNSWLSFLGGALRSVGPIGLLSLGLFTADAAEKDFTLAGAVVRLQDVSADVEVRFQSLRFNRASNVWNVEVSLVNRSVRALPNPVVLWVDSYAGTTGPLQLDGNEGSFSGKGFYDLSGSMPSGGLQPGSQSTPRTLFLGFSSADVAPRLVTKVYVKPAPITMALGIIRSLNDVGQPLPDAVVVETGPSGLRTNRTDAVFGVATLGRAAGDYTWTFSAPGYLPVWRRQTLAVGDVAVIPNPRLTLRNSNNVASISASGGQMSDGSGSIQVQFAASAFPQTAKATLTPLTGQTLPAFLPLGWSPMQAFWLETDREPATPATVTLRPWGVLLENELCALVRWETNSGQWTVAALVSGHGTNAVNTSLRSSGSYALVVGDQGLGTPPASELGQVLKPSAVNLPDYSKLSAVGRMDPPVSLASPIAEKVTATVSITISNQSGALPSGLVLRTEVTESYQLQDGSVRKTPQYESFIVGYQRPGDEWPATLQSVSPLRPLLLFGPESLAEAEVQVQVVVPTTFSGEVLEVSGGHIGDETVQLTAAPGDLESAQAVQIRSLAPSDIAGAIPGLTNVVAAFDLSLGGIVMGHRLSAQLSVLGTGSNYVLARIVSRDGLYGVEPVERFSRNTNGLLVSIEPGGEPRLPGINGAGQYVLVSMASPPGLVSGIARDRQGQPAAGLAVRIAGQPWLTFSAADASFRLVAPTGQVQLTAMDLVRGDSAFTAATLTDWQVGLVQNLSTVPSGPRVIMVTPAAGDTAVARVTPIVVTFDKAINPGTLTANGLQLLDASNQTVKASLTLNLRNTTATLLPASQLAASTRFTILLATNIADPTGLRLQGTNVFTFTTASDALNRLAAQVISYEPTNGLARMVGTPGIAEPESPVIFVNESSGRTATVLSKADGSFDNFIEAEVDDFLSATIVNKNGTHNRIPVSRQLFRDGSVALFNGGGILEAQSDGGPIQVIIEPGSIETKTKFNLLPSSMAEILAMLGGVEPQNGGKVVSGFKLKTEGDPLKSAAKLKMPLVPSSVNVPPGKTLADGVYTLTSPSEFDGVRVFEFIEDLTYQSGFLESSGADGSTNGAASAAFLAGGAKPASAAGSLPREQVRATGASALSFTQHEDYQQFMTVAMGFIGRMGVKGQFVSRNSDGTDERPVPGGTVFVNPSFLGGLPNRKMPAGAIVTTAKNDGFFSIVTDVPDAMWFGGESFYLFGMSVLFPGKIGVGTAVAVQLAGPVYSPIAKGKIHLERAATAAQPDFVPPEIFVTHSPADPRKGEDIRLQVLATDNYRVALIEATLQQGQANVTVDGSPQAEGQSMRKNYLIRNSIAQTLKFRIQARDESGNLKEAIYSIKVGGSFTPPPGLDLAGPQVDDFTPANGARDVDRFSPIVVKFSEPLNPDLNDIAAAVHLPAATGLPWIRLHRAQRQIYVTSPWLQGGTDYTLTIGNQITDTSSNHFDQIPDDDPLVSSFFSSFRTWTDISQGLGSMKNGAGVVGKGPVLFALDRVSDSRSALKIYRKSSAGADLIMSVQGLPAYARNLVFIPGFSYYDALLRKHQKDFVAVVGGKLGVETSQQWFWLFDVTDPEQPDVEIRTHIIRSPTAAVTKLAWSPPMLGYLQYDSTTVDGIGLIDLQLLLYSHGLTNYDNEPFNGQAGFDSNGDGDYTDDLETIPRPIRRMLRDGVFNGGLVGGYNMGDKYFGQITDFGLAFGGRFAAIVHSANTSVGIKAAYRTLAINGEQLPLTTGYYDQFTQTPSRLSLMFGVAVGTDNPRILNLAMVSGGKPGTITVLNITDPRSPVRLSEFPVPPAIGEPKSVLYIPAEAGRPARVIVSGTQSVLVMDPAYLDWSSNSGTDHPGFLGIIPNVGSYSRSFYFNGADFFAVNEGSRSRAVIMVPPPGPCPVPDITINNKVIIPPHAVDVLKSILMSICQTNATITSGKRNPYNQARVMYDNIISGGVTNSLNLYSPDETYVPGVNTPGVKVVLEYISHANESSQQIIAAMEHKIIEVGPCRVSNHCAEIWDTMDVAPSSIRDSDKPAFLQALSDAKASGLIHNYILPPRDPAYHIEIPR